MTLDKVSERTGRFSYEQWAIGVNDLVAVLGLTYQNGGTVAVFLNFSICFIIIIIDL